MLVQLMELDTPVPPAERAAKFTSDDEATLTTSDGIDIMASPIYPLDSSFSDTTYQIPKNAATNPPNHRAKMAARPKN